MTEATVTNLVIVDQLTVRDQEGLDHDVANPSANSSPSTGTLRTGYGQNLVGVAFTTRPAAQGSVL